MSIHAIHEQNTPEEQIQFGNVLTSSEREFLVANSQIKAFRTGEPLCRQNNVDDKLYVILVGEVVVIEEKAADTKITLGKLSRGNLVGEIAALFTVPRIASVYATQPTTALEVSAPVFSNLLDTAPSLSSMVYQKLYERSLDTAYRCATQGKSDLELRQELDEFLTH